jgi:Cu(I)/Ag(I) efflux system membrane protein CusA/SilA
MLAQLSTAHGLAARVEGAESLSSMEGAVERVRPKMMTVVAIMAGLLPIMWSTGTGSEIMQRIAVPMIGGMVSSTPLTLIVIPAIFGLVKGFGLPSDNAQASVVRHQAGPTVLETPFKPLSP